MACGRTVGPRLSRDSPRHQIRALPTPPDGPRQTRDWLRHTPSRSALLRVGCCTDLYFGRAFPPVREKVNENTEANISRKKRHNAEESTLMSPQLSRAE